MEPYYRYLTEDGFTATYSGVATRDGEEFTVTWTYITEVLSESGGVVETSQRVIINLGFGDTETVNFYTVSDEGVLYTGNESSVSAFGITSTTTIDVIGESFLFPREVDVPGELEWSATYETTVDNGFFPTVTTEEEAQRLEFVGYETVTAPVGTFDALKVISYDTVEGETLSGTSWYAPDLGMIRTEYSEVDEEGFLIEFVMQLESLDGEVVTNPLEQLFGGALEINGVAFQDWLGYLEELASGYVFHYGLGYLYPLDSNEDGSFWVYSLNPDLGYLYLNPDWLIAEGAGGELPNGNIYGWVFSTAYPEGWMYIYVTVTGDIYIATADGWGTYPPQ
jgi:hypothetical protein